jgi:hypothetical protein
VSDKCSSSASVDPAGNPVTEIFIDCGGADPSNFGIDLLSTINENLCNSYTALISFGPSGLLCKGTILTCSSDFLNSDFRPQPVFDTKAGTAQFTLFCLDWSGSCFSDGSADETYFLSPKPVRMSGVFAKWCSGAWNYGFGGNWVNKTLL